jgi:hypothetical protein
VSLLCVAAGTQEKVAAAGDFKIRGARSLDKNQPAVGPVFAHENAMPSKLPQPEVLVGRTIALCVHPYAAWRSHSMKRRAVLLFAYIAGSYFIVLGALLSLLR